MSSNLAENLVIGVPIAIGTVGAAWFGGKAIFKRVAQELKEMKKQKGFSDTFEASGREARARLQKFQDLVTPPPP